MKSLIRSLLLALALTTGVWVPVQAQTFEQSLAAYERKDYSTAFAGFKKLAEQGDVPAQFYLGVMYDNGRGVPKDEQQAVVWYRKAAEQGNAGAQYSLGWGYAQGRGVPKDDQQAVAWSGKAAEQGHVTAQLVLGMMYAQGRGVPKDEQQAVVWYRKAAEQGLAGAQYSLGMMYADGQGVPKDEQSAYFWLLLASAQRWQDAVKRRDIVERDLSPEQRAAAQAAVRDWQPKTAAQSSNVPGGSTAGAGALAPAPSRPALATAQADAQALNSKEQERLALEAKAKEQQLENQRMATELALLRAEVEKNKVVKPEILANRKALVIGNDSYRFVTRLKNAREDARTMADSLIKVGYSVTLKLDLSEREMKTVLRNFASTVEGGDEVAFFFAGHGVQIANSNYLVPIDVNGEGEVQMRDEAISLQRVLDDMSEKKAKFTLAIIDACRDNPFKVAGRAIGSSSRGLAPTTAATGQMVIFSAGTGQRALDNLGPNDKNKNGLFTRVFVSEMQKPSVPIDKLLRETRKEVVRLAKSVGHDQVPAIYDQVVGDFYFKK